MRAEPIRPTGKTRAHGSVSQNSTAFVEVDVVLGEPGNRTAVLHARLGQCHLLAWRPTGSNCSGIPRKEVIQPQLPLRLPCYDFTPIIDPTFDGSLPEGLGHRLRVLPTFVV